MRKSAYRCKLEKRRQIALDLISVFDGIQNSLLVIADKTEDTCLDSYEDFTERASIFYRDCWKQCADLGRTIQTIYNITEDKLNG